MSTSRVASWNLNWRVGAAAAQGRLLAELGVDVAALQEVNPRSLRSLCEAAGFEWSRSSAQVAAWGPNSDGPRRKLVAIAGRGPEPQTWSQVPEVPHPHRAIICDLGPIRIGSFHAPPGVQYGLEKPAQAVVDAHHIAGMGNRPIWFGIDANTPKVDHPDFNLTRTHWHTGNRQLEGQPGDDLLVGPDKIHSLRDCFRAWVEAEPARLEAIVRERPDGPLATSYVTRRRRGRPDTIWRYDAIWASNHFDIVEVAYHYERSITAGSDHALVTADLSLNR